MAPKIFITGGTGYIGGSVLDALATQHPDYEITALLRTLPDNVSQLYPKVRIVRGDYDSAELLSAEAAKSNVVVHCGNSDHEPSLHALLTGLLRRPSDTPGFLLHLSGTGVVADWNRPNHLGRLNPKIWSDVSDLATIASLPPERTIHGKTEKILNAAVAEYGERVKVAIVCPPDIYGGGRGPGRRESVLLKTFVKEARGLGAVFYAGEGGNTRSWVHIEDVVKVYLKLVEAAVSGGEGADWGRKGYYFTSTQEASQKQIAEASGKILKAHGILESAEPKQVTLEQVDCMAQPHRFSKLGTYLFASNSRTKADRAEKPFQYKPSAPTLWETLEADLLAAVGK